MGMTKDELRAKLSIAEKHEDEFAKSAQRLDGSAPGAMRRRSDGESHR